jgi:hypothetical protein
MGPEVQGVRRTARETYGCLAHILSLASAFDRLPQRTRLWCFLWPWARTIFSTKWMFIYQHWNLWACIILLVACNCQSRSTGAYPIFVLQCWRFSVVVVVSEQLLPRQMIAIRHYRSALHRSHAVPTLRSFYCVSKREHTWILALKSLL